MTPLLRTTAWGLFSLVLSACSPGPQHLGPIGGPGGNDFDEYKDGPVVPSGTELAAIDAPASCNICGLPKPSGIEHYVQSKYITSTGNQYLGAKHGGGADGCGYPGEPFCIRGSPQTLGNGEFLTGIYGRAGEFVDRLFLITSRSDYSSFDQIEQAAEQIQSGGNPFFLLAPPGYKIREWFGRSGAAVDAIGIIVEPEASLPKTGYQQYKLGAVGGWGGEAFADQQVAPQASVSKIKVTDGCYVYRVKFEYSDGGQTDHGGPGPLLCPGIGGVIVTEKEFVLASDEFIQGIQGRSGRYIDSMSFTTNKRVIGPLGGDGGETFSLTAPPGYKVKRLFGRSGAFLDAVGIVVETAGFPPNQ